MNITELVDLPDPGAKWLVHPLDLTQARPAFRTAWLLGAMANPAVGVCVAAIVWFATSSVVVPLIVFAAVAGFGALARWQYAEQAWAHIPRNRQDRHRVLPLGWDLAAATFLAVTTAAALLLLAERLGQPDVPSGVRDFTIGAGAAVAALMVFDAVAHLFRSGRRAVLLLPLTLVVLGVVAIASQHLYATTTPAPTTIAWGAATMAAAGVVSWVVKRVQRGPTAGNQAIP